MFSGRDLQHTTSGRRLHGRAFGRAAGILLIGVMGSDAVATDLDTILFGSLEAGSGTFLLTGAKIATDTFGKDGPVGLLTIGGGLRTARIACGCGRKYTRTERSGTYAGLVGYQWVVEAGVISALIGADTVFDTARQFGVEGRPGLRIQAEAWLRPTDETLVQTTVTAGTARRDAWARLAWGYRLWDAYLGPETSIYLDETGYRKAAAGFQATDLAVADMRLRVSAGALWETGRRTASPYVSLVAWAPL